MNIVLTASFKNGIFCNGLQQNIVFLAELLKKLGHNPLICIDHSIDECIDPPADILIVEKIEILEHVNDLGFILQCGWSLDKEVVDYIKNKNPQCKNVHVLYGNSLLADIERCSWDTHVAIDPYLVDQVWISPHYKFSFDYFKAYYKTEKVFELPYIWSPKYLDMHEKVWNKEGLSCFYKPGDEKNIAILEPNLNITKHCLPSIMIADKVFRDFGDCMNMVSVYCSTKLMNKKYFKTLMWNLDITRANKIEFAQRSKISKIFAKDCNFVVSHQLLNALNYTYLESLYLNIPLVHNSEFIKSAGYYYPDYDIEAGSKALRKALETHDDNIEEYKSKSRDVLYKYSPENLSVIDRYKKLLS